MHCVLQIPEVLLNIFCHCAPSSLSEEARKGADSDLAALARTCRAFKEPALDILWSELNDPSPLIQCLPGTSYRIFYHPVARKTAIVRNTWNTSRAPDSARSHRKTYSFTGPLGRADWDVLRGYARRVWCLRDPPWELDWKFVARTSMDFTPAEPLFPNLRSLHVELTEAIIPLLHLPFPSLIRLDICLPSHVDRWMLHDPLKSLLRTSSNLKRLNIFYRNPPRSTSHDNSKYSKVMSGVCGWSNLQSLACPQIPLDVDTLTHLSHMPSLARLTFMLGDTSLDWTALSGSLPFSGLNYLKLHAESLALIPRLLSRTRFPAITHFTVIINSSPSKQDLTLFMAGIQVVGMDQTIQEFNLNQLYFASRNPDTTLLDLDDLRPCMAFHRLRLVNLDLRWDVNLSDDELLTLGSAWPRLEELHLNVNWGWNRPGITPNGFALLLETCPSLTTIALAIDTRGYTQMPARQFREPVSPSSFKHPFRLNVLDSVIERKSVDAMAAFFASSVPHFDFVLTAWEVRFRAPPDDLDLYYKRWEDVHSQAEGLIKKQWLNVLCRLFFPS